MESIDAFIDRLPKVELHLHLVGSASVPTVLELRQRHPDGAGVPSSAAELAAFYEFRDFPHFSEVYGAVSSLVREPADVAELVLGAARDLAGQNVRYAELTVTPYTLTSAGMPAAGLTEALDGLRAERIGHGISCLADPALVTRLREIQIPLEVCPTSNVCTRQVDSLAGHPLPRMLADGLFVTLNSDDPPMFGTTLTQEYRQAASVLGLSRAQLADLAANGVRASFLEPGAKQALLAEISAVAAGDGGYPAEAAGLL